MHVIGLDGKEYKINVSKYASKSYNNQSSLHKQAKILIEEAFPFDQLIEEVSLPGSGKNPLYADFFLPSRKIMIEVHGEQHFKFNQHFYATKADFNNAKTRDLQKQEWCTINNIKLIVLNYNEDIDVWKSKIV